MYDVPPAIEYYDINLMSQQSTKRDYPYWWDKHGCKGTQWFGPQPCEDLTND